MDKILRQSAGPHDLTKTTTLRGLQETNRRAASSLQPPHIWDPSVRRQLSYAYCINFPPQDALSTSGVAEATAAVILPARFAASIGAASKYLSVRLGELGGQVMRSANDSLSYCIYTSFNDSDCFPSIFPRTCSYLDSFYCQSVKRLVIGHRLIMWFPTSMACFFHCPLYIRIISQTRKETRISCEVWAGSPDKAIRM